MVKRVAVHLKARLPPFMELDELVQVGMVGLIEAARSFDPTKGFEFECLEPGPWRDFGRSQAAVVFAQIGRGIQQKRKRGGSCLGS